MRNYYVEFTGGIILQANSRKEAEDSVRDSTPFVYTVRALECDERGSTIETCYACKKRITYVSSTIEKDRNVYHSNCYLNLPIEER